METEITQPLNSPSSTTALPVEQGEIQLPITRAELPQSVWTGLLGRYRDIVTACTEAPEEFHVASFITAVGCLVGRSAYVCNPHPIYANFFCATLGKTGNTRKTTAYRFGLNLLEDADKLLDGRSIPLYGLASIEGLAQAMATDTPPPYRVVCVLDEFKSLATKNKQNAVANLIPGITELFNAGSVYQVNTRNKRVVIEGPFLCMLAASTQAWFEESVTDSDVSGGFLNRWLLFAGKTKDLIPFPTAVDSARWTAFVADVASAIKGSKGQYEFSSGARVVYEDFYRRFHRGEIPGIGTSDATARTDLHAVKLGLLFAVLARHSRIEREDVLRGIDIAIYSARIMEPVAMRIGRPAQANIEEKIVSLLGAGPLKKRDLQRAMHVTAFELGSVVKALVEVGSIRNLEGNRLELAN